MPAPGVAPVHPPAAEAASQQPQLLFFYSETSGRSRRVEGFLAQVLQRRRNHDAFRLRRIDADRHQALAERLGVEAVPTLMVVEGKRVRARVTNPRGCAEITRQLAPWLT
jgi:thioredoxin-like negative regulator of GroEL